MTEDLKKYRPGKFELIETSTVLNKTLEAMQAENYRLIKALGFYAKRENWQQRIAHLDAGAGAREILQEVVGHE